MSALAGRFDHSVDAKNRIRIPAKLKADLLGLPVEAEDNEQEKFTVVFHLGTGGCIEVYNEDDYAAIYDKLAGIKKSEEEKYKAASIYLSTFEKVESDPQGRLVIPPRCRKYGKIEKDIKICGRGNYIQIWSPTRYYEYYGSDDLDVADVASLEKVLDV